MAEFKRRALIFGNMGVNGDKGSEYIEGVNLDLINFYNYIRSDIGGAWRKSEIMLFRPNDINKTQLLDCIRAQGHVDYWLIFFSGHGSSDQNGDDFLEVKPEALDDDWLCYIREIVNAVGYTRKGCMPFLLPHQRKCREIKNPLFQRWGVSPLLIV